MEQACNMSWSCSLCTLLYIKLPGKLSKKYSLHTNYTIPLLVYSFVILFFPVLCHSGVQVPSPHPSKPPAAEWRQVALGVQHREEPQLPPQRHRRPRSRGKRRFRRGRGLGHGRGQYRGRGERIGAAAEDYLSMFVHVLLQHVRQGRKPRRCSPGFCKRWHRQGKTIINCYSVP